MKNHYKIIWILLLPCFWQTAAAVSMLEVRQADGSTQTMYFDGMMVRVDSSGEPEYIIIDAGKGNMHIVSNPKKQVVDMGKLMDRDKNANKLEYNVTFVNKGKGPEIAGYPTQHYEVYVNGNKCGDEYTSKKMPRDLGIEKTLEKMYAMPNEEEMEMMQEKDECAMAEQQISSQYREYGYSMRSIATDGTLEFEVLRFDKNAAVPAGAFTLPGEYEHVDVESMLQDLEQNMPEMTPQGMQEMTPEQMQQIQQMMQEMGQPRK